MIRYRTRQCRRERRSAVRPGSYCTRRTFPHRRDDADHQTAGSARIRMPRKLSRTTGTTPIRARVRGSASIWWMTRTARICVRLMFMLARTPFCSAKYRNASSRSSLPACSQRVRRAFAISSPWRRKPSGHSVRPRPSRDWRSPA